MLQREGNGEMVTTSLELTEYMGGESFLNILNLIVEIINLFFFFLLWSYRGLREFQNVISLSLSFEQVSASVRSRRWCGRCREISWSTHSSSSYDLKVSVF